ncbi:hypothetical protein ACEPPN_010231 [Leptodophora sp. 'Broadleaf-Isolate-01']
MSIKNEFPCCCSNPYVSLQFLFIQAHGSTSSANLSSLFSTLSFSWPPLMSSLRAELVAAEGGVWPQCFRLDPPDCLLAFFEIGDGKPSSKAATDLFLEAGGVVSSSQLPREEQPGVIVWKESFMVPKPLVKTMIAAMSVLISKFQNTPGLSAVVQAITTIQSDLKISAT